MKLIILFSVAAFITTLNVAQQIIQEQSPLVCPDYQYKCPSCDNETEICVYPNSGECLGAGIPTCQSIQCEDTFCTTERQPCPDDCPFSCKYNGPPCCPFIGDPICESTCTSACTITPCPVECVGNCHYPDAVGTCCPRSGQAVCNNDSYFTTATIFFDGSNNNNYGYDYFTRLESLALAEVASEALAEAATVMADDVNYDYSSESAATYDGYSAEYGYQGEFISVVYDGYQVADGVGEDYFYPYGYQYPPGENYENYGYGSPYDAAYILPSTTPNEQHHHYVGDNDYFDGLFIGGPDFLTRNRLTPNECTTCIKTVTEIDISLSFVTTTHSIGDIVCAQYIIPCPSACPYDCVYPMDQPCPYIEQPWCPFPENEGTDCIYNTDGYEFPYFPPYDPYYSVFTSILGDAGVTETPAFVTEIATATPVHVCPLIYRHCPIECPNSCLRPNVPCPFAVEGYCPGSSPTTTISPSALETATLSTVVGNHLICPLYILACPYCPEGYVCTRDSIGNCPNTNVPYCIAGTVMPLVITTSIDTPLYQGEVSSSPSSTFYSRPIPIGAPSSAAAADWNFGYGYHPYDNFGQRATEAPPPTKKKEEDVCERSGLTKVNSKVVFDQLQEHRVGCEEPCQISEWDEECDNTCVYQTETTCCIKTICLPNN